MNKKAFIIVGLLITSAVHCSEMKIQKDRAFRALSNSLRGDICSWVEGDLTVVELLPLTKEDKSAVQNVLEINTQQCNESIVGAGIFSLCACWIGLNISPECFQRHYPCAENCSTTDVLIMAATSLVASIPVACGWDIWQRINIKNRLSKLIKSLDLSFDSSIKDKKSNKALA